MKLLLSIIFLSIHLLVSSQYCNSPSTNVTISPSTSIQYTSTYNAGRRAFNFTAVAGNEYTFSTVGETSSDTYLRLYSTGTGGNILEESDDYYNTQSEITWYCSVSGTYSILLTRWTSSSSCSNLNANVRMKYQMGSTSGSTVVTIGYGEGVVYNVPANHYYKYGWSQMIYLQSEINTPGDITKIRFQVDPSLPSNYTAENQKIYMAHTNISQFPNVAVKENAQTNYTSSNYMLVFSGTVNWTIGWVEIVLDTPFPWNNTDNLLIKWENRQGVYTWDEPWFYYTSKTATVGYKHQDSSYPTSDGARDGYRPNIKIAISDPIALPLELISFTGKKVKNSNQLNWITNSENGVMGYIIEKSEDGDNWKYLNNINSWGMLNGSSNYIIYDENPERLINYYRLKEIDLNGNTNTLGIVSIDNKIEDDKKMVKVVNILGQEVDEDSNGYHILIYNDGTTLSVIK